MRTKHNSSPWAFRYGELKKYMFPIPQDFIMFYNSGDFEKYLEVTKI